MPIKKFKPKNKNNEKEITIILPLFIMLPRKTKADKKAIINLNNYPNWHYMTYNEIKKNYQIALYPQLTGLKLGGEISIKYKLFKGTRRKSDKMNVLAVQDKFLCDALTRYECIEDDNDEIVKRQIFEPTAIDTENPRVEAIITYLE